MWIGTESVHCVVDDFLFQGNSRIAASLDWFLIEKVKAVVNVTHSVDCYFREYGIDYLHIRVDDHPDDSELLENYLEEAADFIAKCKSENKKILVHCEGGISRSSTVTLAYLMKHERKALKDSYKLLSSRRKFIYPNDGFWKVLMKWELKYHGSNSLSVDRV